MLLAVLAFARGVLARGARITYLNRHAAVYAIACIVLFWLIYQLMGLKKHFDVPEYLKGQEGSWLNSLYTSALAQSNAMPDITPKTRVARVLFMLQVCSGWIWFLLFAGAASAC